MSDLTGKGLADYAKSKVGTPYFYGCRMEILTNDKAIYLSHQYPRIVNPTYLAKAIAQGQIGRINTDCSGLLYGYTGKNLSSSQLYSTAYTRLDPNTYNDWADGVITWRNGHVGVFYHNLNGDPIVAEAKGISYGTVFSNYSSAKWCKGLTFDWMTYEYTKSVSNTATWRGDNPYQEPSIILRKGSRGEGVKWLQCELTEAGYDLTASGGIDGDFGPYTEKCVIDFQSNTHLQIDGIVGPQTRKALLVDKGELYS